MWGAAAFVICKIYPYMNRMLDKMHGRFWHVTCAVLTVVMVIDMSLTAVSIARWSGRHYGISAKVDVLINNAGMAIYNDFAEKKIEGFEQSMKINLYAPFLLTQILGSEMAKNR